MCARARSRTSCRFPGANLTSIPRYFSHHAHGLLTLPSVPLAQKEWSGLHSRPHPFTTKNISCAHYYVRTHTNRK